MMECVSWPFRAGRSIDRGTCIVPHWCLRYFGAKLDIIWNELKKRNSSRKKKYKTETCFRLHHRAKTLVIFNFLVSIGMVYSFKMHQLVTNNSNGLYYHSNVLKDTNYHKGSNWFHENLLKISKVSHPAEKKYMRMNFADKKYMRIAKQLVRRKHGM